MATEQFAYKTQVGDTTYEGTFSFDVPSTLEEMKEAWGEENTRLGCKKSAVIQAQAKARRLRTQEKPLSAEEVAAEMAKFKPDFSEREYVDPVQRHLDAFGKLSDEAKERLLASMREMLTSLSGAAPAGE